MANLAVAFAALCGGGIVIKYGVDSMKASFSQQPTSSSSTPSGKGAPTSNLKQAWLQAERQQETGASGPNGNYKQNSAGCMGAYCWNTQADWASDATKAGYGKYANTPPYELSATIQDAVAWAIMGPYVVKGQFAQAAELWDGGVPYNVPGQPGVPGNDSAGYAQEVIAKFKSLLQQAGIPFP